MMERMGGKMRAKNGFLNSLWQEMFYDRMAHQK